jgi:hypothetical protein
MIAQDRCASREPSPDITIEEFNQIVEPLERDGKITSEQTAFLRNRWLKQVLWWQKRAVDDKRKYFRYSEVALIFSATTTALSGINLADLKEIFGINISALILIFSLIVTIATGLEKLHQFGQVYMRKRRYAELLKILGWQFIQLTNGYENKLHRDVYPDFAKRVEDLIRDEIEGYANLFNAAPSTATLSSKNTSENEENHTAR